MWEFTLYSIDAIQNPYSLETTNAIMSLSERILNEVNRVAALKVSFFRVNVPDHTSNLIGFRPLVAQEFPVGGAVQRAANITDIYTSLVNACQNAAAHNSSLGIKYYVISAEDFEELETLELLSDVEYSEYSETSEEPEDPEDPQTPEISESSEISGGSETSKDLC